LAEQLSEPHKSEVQTHVEACAACQHLLERLAGAAPTSEGSLQTFLMLQAPESRDT
jgi:hypothetical protein